MMRARVPIYRDCWRARCRDEMAPYPSLTIITDEETSCLAPGHLRTYISDFDRKVDQWRASQRNGA